MNKKDWDRIWEEQHDLIHILNKVFMDGGRAYNPWKGLRRRFQGYCGQTEWQLSMAEGVAALEALSNQKSTGGNNLTEPSGEGENTSELA